MTKTETQQRNPALIGIMAGFVVLGALWFSGAATATSWALRHGYFTTSGPAFTLPGANPTDAGPTLLTITGLAAIALGIVAAVMMGIRMAAPVQHDPDDRRPVPPVAAPVLAATALIGGLLILVLIPFVPDLIAASIGIIAAYGLGDLLTEKLRERRERARYLNEIEWALYPYLGYDELPRRRVVAITEWDEEVDGQPEKPKAIQLAYRGRREELKPELSRRLDDAVGSHYTLFYATTDQLITATLASVNTESPTVRGLREQISSTELFASGATITDLQYSESGDIVRFTVHHQIGAKLSGTDRIRSIARKISDLLPGRWRATRCDHLAGTAVFEIRPELPTKVYPPIKSAATTVEEACATYDHAAIPLAVDEEGNVIEWNLKVNPHMLLMGPTGTGKTRVIDNALVHASRLGVRIFIIDFKGGEFTSYRNYPNVVAVITEPYEAIALVNTIYKEMQARYNLYKRDRRALDSKEPFMIIFDEYTEFQEAIKTFYANHKEKRGAARDCLTLRQFSSLLRLGRTSRFHCVAALQRADADFLKGEAKDNFTQRLSLGKLSPQAAMMIHNDANAGRTVPLGIRGRGTSLNSAGWPTEVQAFYVPDPSDPADEDERQIVDELRPSASLYERGIVMPPDWDPNDGVEDFSEYLSLPLLKASEYPQFDPHAADYAPPRWLDFQDRGVESIFGAAPGGPRPVTPASARELVSIYDQTDGESRRVEVTDLEVGDYLCHPDTGEWAILDEEPGPGESPDATVLILRDVYSGEREETEVASDALVEVRDLAETHLAAV